LSNPALQYHEFHRRYTSAKPPFRTQFPPARPDQSVARRSYPLGENIG